MLADWSSLLLLSSALLTPVYAKYGHAKVHEGANVKRQAAQETSKARWDQLHKDYLANLRSSLEPDGQCTWDNMVVRREWGDMTSEAKKDYLAALQCLKTRPSRTNRDDFPGVRSRFDDFTVAHLLNTGTVHRSPWLAVWHRHYIWRFERALIEECGYKHGHPYWHWSKYLGTDPNSWPMFDNSETSISGNGTQTGEQCACVNEGPLKDWKINLGPSEGGWGCQANPRPDGYGYNPRCIERTFQSDNLNTLKYSDVVHTIDDALDANQFASFIELEDPSVHNYPHIFMGGTQIDVTFSSQDPWFFFHHMMVEFIFDIWQSQDWDRRTTSLPTPEIFNEIRSQGWSMPVPAPNLDSEIFLAPVFGNVTVRDAMWPTRKQYCYRYE
ncbi:Putative tyrosinase copper-binding domain, di-copper centre-containing domain superfamily [Septoria linicola]|uniref:Tyrosinase copper-binding domain, di-copper centre-containing domain superfamily n=1 Tax=Septoria linicola TaxID=215465 RepID=A0A9Q9EIM0_9PEZI|nr:putative tyrosinase copper-binding domain, di-copper centre-containing domain superfamily [Septoria linicola]USW50493.1 Putative tyrosinase copper-binding domain, di-copper centre-containing domain superfamily [Septoria linicola]